MAPASWYLIHERKQTAALSVCAYLRMTWELLRSKAMFHVVLYQFWRLQSSRSKPRRSAR